MKVYGAISSSSSSHAEDAPLLVHTNTHAAADEKKPLPFVKFKGAKTIALAVAGVAACGAVAIVANTTTPGSNGSALSAFRLGDALDDAKAGKKDFCSNIRDLSLSCEKDSIRFDRVGCRRRIISSLVHSRAMTLSHRRLPMISSSRRLFR
jgi:hypothetical protein